MPDSNRNPEPEDPDIDPLAQNDALTLEAELRQALQHQRAAYEQAEETREEMRLLMERARNLLNRTRSNTARTDPSAREAGGTEESS